MTAVGNIMVQTFALALALLTYLPCSLALATHLPRPPHQQIISDDYNITIRSATELDLDDITTVIIDAFSPGPLYQYIFPRLNHYKKRLWQCSREEAGREFANMTHHDLVNVIAVPVSKAGTSHTVRGDRNERVVSVAIWNVMDPAEEITYAASTTSLCSYFSEKPCQEHIGMNMTRALDFSRQFDAAEKRYVEEYPGKQIYLNMLATHPDWDGHGFGAAQVQWGIAMAAKLGLPSTLIGTPAGWPLYDSLRFESVANITIKTLDSADDLWFEYMRYNASSDLR